MTIEKLKPATIAELQTAKQKALDIETDSVGVKNIVDVVQLVFALVAVLIVGLRNGIGLGDIMAVFGDEDVREHFPAALQDADRIPLEVADISIKEGLKISRIVIDELDMLFDRIR